ncbi:MAG: response regulator [Acidimicrobiia bacterium]|nr:response regulator [Acidimicrobiia bacterium]
MRGLVLIVEDSEQVAANLEIALEGWQVAVTGSAEEALEVLRQGEVRAVITDLDLPRMDGAELIRRLRRERGDVPVIVTSGRAEASAEELGADAFFGKPYSPAKVREELERLLHEKNS